MQSKCFKCEKPIEAAMRDPTEDDYWDAPCGLRFRGGSNYGSTVFDTLVTKKELQLLVCDDCLKEHMGLTREVNPCDSCACKTCNPEHCKDCMIGESDLQKAVKKGRTEGKSFRQILDEFREKKEDGNEKE